jgi:serine/threonine-protein kinase HipA
MGRPSKHRRLAIWANGELVAQWTTTPRGESQLTYASSWFDSPQVRPLSLALPLPLSPATALRGPAVDAWFENLLPDSARIRQRIAARFAVRDDPFELLSAVGRDCVGAIQLVPEGAAPDGWDRIDAKPMREADVERHLDAVLHGGASRLGRIDNPGPDGGRDDDEFRLSLAGAQEKSALLRHRGRWQRPRGATPTTHILKLPLGPVGRVGADMSNSVDNEWVCLTLARAYGLPAAQAHIERFGRHRVLVVQRFDRRLDPRGVLLRLPQEDFCQALGVPPAMKYESDGGPGLAPIAAILRQARDSAGDLRRLMSAQVLFWLLRAPDGHAKNFSLQLHAHGEYSLAPLYDVLSAWPIMGQGPNQFDARRLKLAMALVGKNRHYNFSRVERRHFASTAQRAGFGGLDAHALVQALIDDTPRVIDDVRQAMHDMHRRKGEAVDERTADSILDGVAKAAAQLAASAA